VRLWQHGPRLLRALLSLACLLLASSTPRPLQLFDVVIDVEQEMRKSAEIAEDIFDEAYTYRTFTLRDSLFQYKKLQLSTKTHISQSVVIMKMKSGKPWFQKEKWKTHVYWGSFF
jgi:type II secretory pathway component PulL